MADDYQIENPTGGPPIVVPGWASEATFRQIEGDLNRMTQIDEALVKVSANFSKDLQDMFQGIASGAKGDTAANKAETAETKNATKATKKLAGRVVEAASFMGNTERPLTSIVGALKEAGPAIGGALSKFIEPLGNAVNKLEGGGSGGGLSALGRQLSNNKGVITDAAFMWLGWNAGKLEAFSEVQQQMIDNGAIMFENHNAFNDLRVAVNRSGVTYDAFSKTIAANGSAINAFGGNVSLGTKRFADFFGNLEESADALGDFGISNAELLQQSGEFLEYQRITGGLKRSTAGLEEDLTTAFTQLQIETAGLASITGLQRSQLLQNRLQVTNVDFAAGLANLEGDEREAANEARVILADMQSVAGEGSPLTTLSNATARALAVVNGNLAALDIEEVAQAMNPNDVAALKKAFGQDIFDQLELAIQSGDSEAVQQVMFDTINADVTRLGTAIGSVTDPLAGASNSLAQAMFQIKQVFGDITVEELAQARENATKGLAEAGTSTVLLNDATKAFLAIQETFTLNMDTLSKAFGGASEVVNDVVQFFNNNSERMYLVPNMGPDEIEAMEKIIKLTEEGIPQTINNMASPDDMMMQGSGFSEIAQEYNSAIELLKDAGMTNPANIDQETLNWYKNNAGKAFGGVVSAGSIQMIGEKGPELFVSEKDGKILSNRELNDLMNTELTPDANSSIMEINIEEEYKQAIATKKQTLAVLENVRKAAKNKMLDDRLKAAIDASGA